MDGLDQDGGHHPGVQLTEKRRLFLRLIRAGVNNSDACRMAGINRRTGTRWRFGRSILNRAGQTVHYPPVITTPMTTTSRSDRYLSLLERTTIADLHRTGSSVRAIAAELGRAPSTISRELRRNTDDRGRYLPHTADKIARSRLPRPRERRISRDRVLREAVTGCLTQRWSPEQVAHELRERFGADCSRQLCPESIYQAIYDPGTPLTRPAKTALRTHRRRRRPRTSGTSRRGRLISMTMISDRPAEVEDRCEAGHWEGDLIIGKGQKSAIGTLVERRTRYVILVHVPGGRTAEAIRDGLHESLGHLPRSLRRTLTWDQGKEMALHAQTSQLTGLHVYFCEPHSPWQRGSNENMNGLLRQYFPKGTDLRIHSPQDLARVAAEINTRPRKTLGWATPATLFDQLLSAP